MNTELKALEDMVRAAVEAEGVPLPAIWKNSVVELCVRVISKYAMDQQPRAALIAAAPAIYEALKDVFVIGDTLVGDVFGHEFVEKAKAALAKAEVQA